MRSFSQVREELPDTRRVEVSGGVELEVLHLEGGSPALVFVHGAMGSLWNPYTLLDRFHGDREMVSYSIAGNRGSDAPPEQSLDEHVRELKEMLEELEIERPVLHGHSYGSTISLEYAKKHDVSGLIIHGGGSHGLMPSWERPLVDLCSALRLYRFGPCRWLMRKLAVRAAVEERTERIEDFLQTNSVPTRRSAWRTVRESFWGYDGREDLEEVDVPVLVIHGREDGIVPLEVAEKTVELLPEGRLEVLEDSGHVGFVEQPDLYSELVEDFLEEVA
ncbi:MAG: alpha/beta fold hydrolase [Candidatus Nanohaloarchaea archaeon]